MCRLVPTLSISYFFMNKRFSRTPNPLGNTFRHVAKASNPSGNDFRQARKCQTFRETTFAKRGNAKPLGKRLSPSAEMSNLSGNDFRHARKCQTLRETTFAKRGNAKPLGKRLSPCAEIPNHSGNLLDEDVFYFFQTLIPIFFMDGNVAHLFKPRRLYSRSSITIPSRNPTPTFERHKITSSSSIMTISCA